MSISYHFQYFLFRARLNGCGKRLHKPVDVDDPRHYKFKGDHIHTGDSRKISKKKVMTKLKDLAKNTKQPIRQVISESIYGVKKATKAKLPSEKVLARIVSRYRSKPGVPKNPQSLLELKFPEEYRNTVSNKPFLLYDSFDLMDEEMDALSRSLIFTTSENLTFLSKCDELYMDGTFSVTPHLFKQLYTIHGNFNEKKIHI